VVTISPTEPLTVSVDSGRNSVEHLVLHDPPLDAFVRDTREELRGSGW